MEKIKEIEAEMARTQKNSKSEQHRSIHSKRIISYRSCLVAPPIIPALTDSFHITEATNYHLGTLKAKLARLRDELFVEQSGGSGGGGDAEGFSVSRNGDARVALIGFPSVGKSTLLGALTTTQSETAAYEL
jgi:ribosome-interacting GTPase 1